MKEIHTLVASRTGVAVVESVSIIADVPVPSVGADNWETIQREQFGKHGKEVVEAMMKHMPGGLVDAIFGELCQRKATVFHVAHKDGAAASSPQATSTKGQAQ